MSSVVIAGGGSGGHVFPGLAIADALRERAAVDVVFAGTARGMEASVIPKRGYELELLDVAPIKGGGLARAVRGSLVAARAMRAAVALIRRYAPRVVVSVGGYAAGPVALAAEVLGIPVGIVEPNAVVGFTNRLLGPLARRAYVAWGRAATSFGERKTRRLGVPLRSGFGPRPYDAAVPRRVLVLGGSQGAAALNERVPRAIGRVARENPELQVLHQAGKDKDERVCRAYAEAGVASVTVLPFLDDVARELAAAELVVARSGAGTVAEIAAVGRPAVLLPFPHAADDHQLANARALEEAGGAVCLPDSEADETRIAAVMASLLVDRDRRVRMSAASGRFGKPDAAMDIARDLCELAGLAWSPAPRGPDRKINGAAARAEAR